MKIVQLENSGLPSFQETARIVEIATRTQQPTAVEIFGKIVVARPGDCPHKLYRSTFPELISPNSLEKP